jgi:hypothetical protein
VEVERTTQLSPALTLMQAGMSDAEKRRAIAMRAEVCRKAAEFFVFIRNPDSQVEVFDPTRE